jgi:hypothetical protein
MLRADGNLRIGRCRRNDAGIERFGNFDGGQTDTARRAEDQDGLAGSEPGSLLEGVVDRSIGNQEGARNIERHAVRHGDEHLLADGRLFRKCANSGQGNDSLANRVSRDAVTRGHDRAGKFHPWSKRQ